MPDRLLTPAAVATLLCLTTTAVTAQTPGTMTAEKGWSSIARCAQEDTERARHTCLDRVLRDAGLLTPEMHALQERRAFGLDDKQARATPPPPAATATPPATAAIPPAASAEALNRRAARTAPGGVTPSTATAPSLPTAAPSPAAAAAPPPAKPAHSPAAARSAPAPLSDRLEVELANVEKAVNGNLFVTTTDGAVWLQAESVEMPQPPVAGDRMTIRKGSMGGYRCSVTSTHLTYRCTRSQ